jgi:sugar (pentulose or hexulose) kinase
MANQDYVRTRIKTALAEMHAAVCALGVSDMDAEERACALGMIAQLSALLADGFESVDKQRRYDEEAAIIKAYREGRVTVRPK